MARIFCAGRPALRSRRLTALPPACRSTGPVSDFTASKRCGRLLTPPGLIGRLAADASDAACKPVRALLFDKTPAANWSLAWHQDRTIAVVRRKPVEGFGPWTVKRGRPHVEPPFELLTEMVTLRIHLDPVTETNAPLLIAPGSHRFGRVPEKDIAHVVEECGVTSCTADAGDAWIYSTPILHASEAAINPTHRRVLQVDFAKTTLPGGLEWLGI